MSLVEWTILYYKRIEMVMWLEERIYTMLLLGHEIGNVRESCDAI